MTNSPTKSPGARTKLRVKVFLGLVVLLLVLVLIAQNVETAPVRFLFYTFEAPRAALLAITYGAGFISGMIFLMWFRRTS